MSNIQNWGPLLAPPLSWVLGSPSSKKRWRHNFYVPSLLPSDDIWSTVLRTLSLGTAHFPFLETTHNPTLLVSECCGGCHDAGGQGWQVSGLGTLPGASVLHCYFLRGIDNGSGHLALRLVSWSIFDDNNTILDCGDVVMFCCWPEPSSKGMSPVQAGPLSVIFPGS